MKVRIYSTNVISRAIGQKQFLRVYDMDFLAYNTHKLPTPLPPKPF